MHAIKPNCPPQAWHASTLANRQIAWPLLVLIVGVMGAATSAKANETLWHEYPPDYAARVALPSLAPIVKKVEPAVLTIQVEANVANARGHSNQAPPFFRGFGMEFRLPEPPPMKGQGSGFIIHESGYALTNYHVIENADRIQAKVGSKAEFYDAEVIGTDPKTDVALIKLIGGKKPWPYIPLGDSDRLEIGDFVMAIGNPFGLSQTVSSGIISANHRRNIAPSGRHGLYDFLQTDASINPGNSGGPLLNLKGEVVGINAAVNSAGQGLGFAIPINLVKKLVPQLQKRGSVARSWIGVGIQPVTPELAPGLGLKQAKGALVAQVIENSPGEKAGLEPGDVILRFNGKPIENSSDLPLLAAHVGIGKKVEIELLRNRKKKRVFITLGELPDQNRQAAAKPRRGGETLNIESLGLRAGDVTRDAQKRLGLKRRIKGALVYHVTPHSSAQRAGLIPNDIIVKVNDQKIASAESLATIVSRVKSGGLVRMLVRRGGATVFIAVVKS
jgi:serine protease Do